MTKIKFDTDGWSSKTTKNFNLENIQLVTKAIGFYIKDNYSKRRPVIIGYDTRENNENLAKEIAQIINSMGYNTLTTNTFTPSPAIAFAAKDYKSAGAIVLTAIDKSSKFNGIKYIPDYAGPANVEVVDEIKSYISLVDDGSVRYKPVAEEHTGKNEYFDPKDEYIDFLVKSLDLDKFEESNLKISFDSLFGTSQIYFPDIINKISNIEVNSINKSRDYLFGGSKPKINESNSENLKKIVKENESHLGISINGDSSSFSIVDEKGKYYSSHQIVCLLFRHLAKNKGFTGKISRTIATTHLLDKLSNKYKLELLETSVGFKNIGSQIRQKEIVFGGDESGGIAIKDHIADKDGILGSLLFIEMLIFEKKALSEIWSELLKECNSNIFNDKLELKVSNKEKKEIINQLRNNTPSEIGDFKVSGYKIIDGIKLNLDDELSWVLIRPSENRSIIEVYIESNTIEKLNNIKDKSEKIIKNGRNN